MRVTFVALDDSLVHTGFWLVIQSAVTVWGSCYSEQLDTILDVRRYTSVLECNKLHYSIHTGRTNNEWRKRQFTELERKSILALFVNRLVLHLLSVFVLWLSLLLIIPCERPMVKTPWKCCHCSHLLFLIGWVHFPFCYSFFFSP